MSHRNLTGIIIFSAVLSIVCSQRRMTADDERFVLPEAKIDTAASEQRQDVSPVGPERLNPFLSFEEEKKFAIPKEPIRVALDYFLLSAIFCSPEKTESKAIINGMIYKVGDEIDTVNSKRIIEIQPKRVILTDADGIEYLLMLR